MDTRRRKNLALFGVLLSLAILLFATTLVKLGHLPGP